MNTLYIAALSGAVAMAGLAWATRKLWMGEANRRIEEIKVEVKDKIDDI